MVPTKNDLHDNLNPKRVRLARRQAKNVMPGVCCNVLKDQDRYSFYLYVEQKL